MSSLLLVIAGAAVGAPIRYLVDHAERRWIGHEFPLATLAVNVVGSFLLGWVVAGAGPNLQLLLGAGLCGALTTYSTFALESVELLEARALAYAAVNVGLSVALGLGAAWLGLRMGG